MNVAVAIFVAVLTFGGSWLGASPLALTLREPVPAVPGQRELVWPTNPGRQYFVEASNDLRQWELLPRFAEGDGGVAVWQVSAERERRFFRLWEYESPDDEWVTQPAATTLARYLLFFSAAVGRPVSCHVLLPPGYAIEPQRRYPVLYWLHGSGPGIQGVPGVGLHFYQAMVDGLIPPMIVVFANGLPDGMWTNSTDGRTPVESMLIDDLIPEMDRRFRTIARREGRIVEGFSMGGYGAGRLGLKFPETFRAFTMMGAGPLQLDFLENDPNLQPMELRVRLFEKVWANDMQRYLEDSPWHLAGIRAAQPGPVQSIRMVIGTKDSMLANNRMLHERLSDLEIPHTYIELPGIGHQPLAVLQALAPAGWEFYRGLFGELP